MTFLLFCTAAWTFPTWAGPYYSGSGYNAWTQDNPVPEIYKVYWPEGPGLPGAEGQRVVYFGNEMLGCLNPRRVEAS
jgi:hypothetical protein